MTMDFESPFLVEEHEMRLIDIAPSNLPALIETQVQQLYSLSENVDKAMRAVETAKQMAAKAHGVKVGFFRRDKPAIEALQQSAVESANANMTLARAQEVSFQFQRKLSETTKNLFLLGAGNLALNRSTVRELEARLKGASRGEISALARSELNNVIAQLKAQDDILSKLQELESKIKLHNDLLQSLENAIQATNLSLLSTQGTVKILGDTQNDLLCKQQNIKNTVRSYNDALIQNTDTLKGVYQFLNNLFNSLPDENLAIAPNIEPLQNILDILGKPRKPLSLIQRFVGLVNRPLVSAVSIGVSLLLSIAMLIILLWHLY